MNSALENAVTSAKAQVIPLPLAAKPSPTISPRPGCRLSRWVLWLGLALLITAAALFWRALSRPSIAYETARVERGSIQASVTATGTLNPVVSVQVGSQVSGNIKALYADFNTKVKKGQLVALIDPQIFQAQVDQASGAAASASAAIVTATAQVEKAKADLAGAVANKSNLESVLAKDQANAINARAQWQRSDVLYQQGIVSQQDHDVAKAAFDASQAQVTADQAQIAAAEHTIQSLQAQVNVALTQLDAAQAQSRQAHAALTQAQINLGHTRILAPVSGTVIARYMDVGQTVAASFQAPTIFNIAQDLTKMQVDTNVNESDVGGVRVGQAANFTVDAFPGTIFHGTVSDVRKAPINAQNVVTYDAVVTVDNPESKLFPGMTANVTILTARLDDVLKVPNAALRFHPSADVLKPAGLTSVPQGTQFYVLRSGKLSPVVAKVGISDGRFTSVTDAGDLKAGDSVVVRAAIPAQTGSTPAQPTTMRRLPGT